MGDNDTPTLHARIIMIMACALCVTSCFALMYFVYRGSPSHYDGAFYVTGHYVVYDVEFTRDNSSTVSGYSMLESRSFDIKEARKKTGDLASCIWDLKTMNASLAVISVGGENRGTVVVDMRNLYLHLIGEAKPFIPNDVPSGDVVGCGDKIMDVDEDDRGRTTVYIYREEEGLWIFGKGAVGPIQPRGLFEVGQVLREKFI